ncbi:hypothetical protein WMF37_28905 [Sorangium sp. So ce291]|uniref:hypothetical protein n=1 Tax=Sorangium sp. So ce291 TaxID=3133294 RepID=UPI003F5D9052
MTPAEVNTGNPRSSGGTSAASTQPLGRGPTPRGGRDEAVRATPPRTGAEVQRTARDAPRQRQIRNAILPLVTAALVHVACSSPPTPWAVAAHGDGGGLRCPLPTRGFPYAKSPAPQVRSSPAAPPPRGTCPDAVEACTSDLSYVDFNNQTNQTWTMVIFQTLPGLTSRDSVSWKQATAPPSGIGGVSWASTFNVVIASYTATDGGGAYKESQTLSASLGSAWSVSFTDGVQQLMRVGETARGQIRIINDSDRLANLGVGVDGQGSVYQRGVLGKVAAQFVMSPTYWVGLFEQAQLGQVVSTQVINLGPWKLRFSSGQNLATVTASIDEENIRVNVEYSSRQPQ